MKCTNGCGREVTALTMANDEEWCYNCWDAKIDKFLGVDEHGKKVE